MFGTTFSHGTLRKYIIYFGTLFNNLWVNRYDSTNVLIQNLKVPLNFGPREKFLARLDGNPDSNRPIAIQLPRMSFDMSGFRYDPARATNKLNKITIANPDMPGHLSYQYAPVPWDIDFTLSIMTKTEEDGTYILEQILPYFSPSWSATLNINEDVNQTFDVPIYLNDISHYDTYEGVFEKRRAIIWELKFTIKAWFFGPTKTNGTIIKQVELNFRVPPVGVTISDALNAGTSDYEYVRITPGLYANGDPAEWYGANTASIRPSTVAANTIISTDDYGFMIDFMEE